MHTPDQHDHEQQHRGQDHDTAGDPAIPAPADRDTLNAALHTTGADTGFWDDHGRPAPWPDDIDEWTTDGGGSSVQEPGDRSF